MTTYKELIAQREELERQILQARQTEMKAVITEIRSLVTQFELSEDDIFPARRVKGERGGGKIEPKYRNPETGDTWSGRGKAPKWIQGQDRAQFQV